MKLIKRPLGIGRLDDPPTFLFQYQPGPATLATLVSLGGERFRLVVAEGENLDSQELPALEMPYGQFRPNTGVRACLNAWLAAGGPHHEVMNLGRHAASWRVFCQLAGHRVRAGMSHCGGARVSSQDVGQAEADRLLQLAEAAGLRVAVRAPPDELGRVPEPGALHVVVADLDHPLGAQRDERQVLVRVPPAVLGVARVPGPRLAVSPSSTGAPRSR